MIKQVIGQKSELLQTWDGKDAIDHYCIGRRIAILNSGIGYQILTRHTDQISDIRYRISESDIIRQMIKNPIDGNAKL